MNLPANKKLVLPTTATPTPPTHKEHSGWDPFEVWRTRVLLPRLAEAREEKATAALATSVQLVRS